MKETRGNLWDFDADFTVITTNGTIKRNGAVVMGRGCAREARDRFPMLDEELGHRLRMTGNHVHVLSSGIVSFPVKHNWWEQADVALIEQSARELQELGLDMDGAFGVSRVASFVMPRPGCGNGGLTWDVVKPIIEPILDDRFTVITF